ncbi:hypothetical protein AFLA_003943 [Aspergillus flavus NRRL3357]|nr:hypothetical protein AFLA_003943 [Aspergillus flavus NRRL3357]
MLSVYNNLSIRSLIDPPGSPYPQHYAMDGQPFGEEVQTNSHELLVIGSHLNHVNYGSPRHLDASSHKHYMAALGVTDQPYSTACHTGSPARRLRQHLGNSSIALLGIGDEHPVPRSI